MAGAGYKLFNTGDVLTAAQVNTYLQEQAVMRFANSTARTTALSGVLAEGMVSYLDDTNAVEVYNGSAWVGVSGTGDVTEVQAGTGISVASGTGPIPVVTNTMATTIDAKGDLIVGTGADTFARLAVGATNDHVLTIDSSTSTGLKWAAVSGGASGPAFRVYRATSAQAFNQSTFTKVQFNGETFDTDNCFDSTTNYRFTPNKAGYYSFQSTTFVSKTSQNRARGAIYKNGSIYSQVYNQINTSTDYAYSGAALIYANGTTDYFEFFVYDEDGTSREVNFGELGNGTYWSGVWIRS